MLQFLSYKFNSAENICIILDNYEYLLYFICHFVSSR